MADIARLGIEINSSGVPVAKKRLDGFRRSAGATEKATNVMTAAIGKAVVALGGFLILRKVIRVISDFEVALAEVASISHDVAENTGDTARRLREFSDFGKDATESAKALYQTISAGVTDTEEAFRLLEVASRASVAGLTDTKTAVDVLTSAINSYGRSTEWATQVSDILFTAVREGKTTFAELASQLGMVMSIAAQTGVSFEEVAAAVVTLTKGGISTDKAVTGLRATLTTLLKPTSESAELAEKLGIGFSASALRASGLGGVLREVTEATRGDAEAMAKLFPNVRALAAVMNLAGSQAEEFARQIDIMGESAGTTQVAFEKMADTAWFQFMRATKAGKNLAVSIGTVASPIAKRAFSDVAAILELMRSSIDQNVQAAKDFVESFNKEVDVVADLKQGLDAIIADIREANEVTKEHTESVVEENKAVVAIQMSLENERRELTLTSEELLIYKLASAGATEEDKERALSLFHSVELLRESKVAEKSFSAQLTATANAVDKYVGNIARLKKEFQDYKDELNGVRKVSKVLVGEMQSIWINWSDSVIDSLLDAEKLSELTFDKIAADFAKMVAKMMLQQVVLKALGLESAFGPARGAAARGAAFSGGSVLPLARGGVVTRPTLFPMAGGAGLMGEAGPEAVMPLTRTSSGDLGVKAETVSPVVNLNIINNTGEQVTESRRSSAQGVDIDVVIGESVKQHLNKGTFDRSMRSTFGLSRRGVQR